MMSLKSNARDQQGFTLLELLISITLLGLIVLITAGALRAGYRSTESSQKKIEGIERFRTSLSVIESQMQSAFVINRTGDTLDTEFSQFSGDKTRLQFRSVYSLWGGGRGPVLVNYEIRDGDMGMKTLYASETPIQIPDLSREVKLFDNARDIYFEY
ncbi:MAG TPA: prepilin-type N-terminal cleavage/methylation domain-containing protein, partial [Dissulfurispiraceae bacterium]|nr:prepilin-type N-terminal cleavage/methylation domain-containing protein [Dissulfurispiraceae bacterium]